MTVDGGIAVIIHHIEHIARAVGDTDTRNISVRQRTYRFAYGATGLEIQSAMKMVGTYLAKVTGENDRKIKRRSEGSLLCPSPDRYKEKRQNDRFYVYIHCSNFL